MMFFENGADLASMMRYFQISGDFGEPGEGGCEIFNDLKSKDAGVERWRRVIKPLPAIQREAPTL